MLFPYNAETYEITEKLLKDYADGNREARINYYQTRYNELENNIWHNHNGFYTFQYQDQDDNEAIGRGGVQFRSSPYFPRLQGESDDAYAERTKIWIPWPQFICKRFANIALKGKTTRKWVAINESDEEIAKRANELHEACMENNDWETLSHRIYFYSLGLGEMHLWPDHCLYNPKTGEKYEVAGGQGITKWSDWFPWFVEPLITDNTLADDMGSLKLYYFDGQQATPYISQTAGSGGEKVVVQLYLAPFFNPRTGKAENEGKYIAFENGERKETVGFIDSEGNESGKAWSEYNHYRCNPVVKFCSPDYDESGIRGKSFIDRFIDLAVNHSQFISEIGQTISLLPNVWNFDGEAKDIKNIKIRKSKINANPNQGGKGLYQAAREVNVEPDFKFSEYLAATIGLAAQFPMQAFNMQQPTGDAFSGVALKILLEPFVEAIQAIRRENSKPEKKVMRVEVMMFNAANPSNTIDLTKIRPEIVYEENLIPIDEAAELVNDISLKAEGAMTDEEFIMKWNPSVTTEKQAQERADKYRADKKANQQASKFNFSPLNKQAP